MLLKLGRALIALLTILNIAFVILFLASCLSSRIDPSDWWMAGFLPLILPYLALAVSGFLPVWLFVRPRRALLSLLGLLAGSGSLLEIIPPNLPKEFKSDKQPGAIRVMTWNLRHFAPFKIRYADLEKMAQQEAIRREVDRYKPDVMCFQEFVNLPLEDGTDVLRKIMEEQGFTHYYFSGDRLNLRSIKTGMVIFSKYPILWADIMNYPVDFEQTGEKSIMADIEYGGDTLRFYSIHMQSFGFNARDYWTFRRLKSRSDSGMASAKSLLGKMKQTFQVHSEEAKLLASFFDSCRHHLVICGDMNDVPASYTYSLIRGDRRDVHLDKGYGLGKTYTSPSSRTMGKLPSLRIDYILADPVFETLQSTRGQTMLSDHQAMVADILLTQKK